MADLFVWFNWTLAMHYLLLSSSPAGAASLAPKDVGKRNVTHCPSDTKTPLSLFKVAFQSKPTNLSTAVQTALSFTNRRQNCQNENLFSKLPESRTLPFKSRTTINMCTTAFFLECHSGKLLPFGWNHAALRHVVDTSQCLATTGVHHVGFFPFVGHQNSCIYNPGWTDRKGVGFPLKVLL